MSGVDAIGGFSYQHAQAIHAALRLAEDDHLERIRVEAENDVIDVEVWGSSDVLVDAFQYKRRREPYTWGQQELIDELVDWSALGRAHSQATYRFVTDGRLGPTGRDVRDALEDASEGNLAPLASLMENAKSEYDLEVVRRAAIVVDNATYNALFGRARVRAKSQLANVSGPAEADERSRWVVLELLNLITDRSGQVDGADRFITRDEVLQLLATPQDRLPTTSWTDEFKMTFIASVLSSETIPLVDLETVPDTSFSPDEDNAGANKRLLEKWTDNSRVSLLGGGAGSGKSTALLRLQHREAQRGNVVVVADAEDYTPGRLAALVAASLNRHANLGAHPAVGNAALKDPEVTVAIDGVSEVSPALFEELRQEIRAISSATSHATLILVGRDTTALRSSLTRHANSTALKMAPLDYESRNSLVAKVFKTKPDSVVRSLVAAAVRALGDAADNPLMLLLGVRTLLLDGDATSPASVFRTVVRSISDDNGYSNASVYEVALGIAFCRLLEEGTRYTDSFRWTTLLKDVAEQLVSLGHLVNAEELREYGFETGLVRVTQLDSIRPLHDAFADYLSAAALTATPLVSLPDSLHTHDRARVRFVAQLSGVNDELAKKTTRDLPLTAVNIAPYNRIEVHDAIHDDIKAYVRALMPPPQDIPRIACWEDAAGRLVVTVGGKFEGFWRTSVPDGIASSGWTFPLTDQEGPMQVAVRIWRRTLVQILAVKRADTSAAPQNLAQSKEILSAYSDGLHLETSRLIGAIGILGEEGAGLVELSRERIQFLLDTSAPVEDERDRSVRFRYLSELGNAPQVLESAEPPDNSWTGWGRVDSFLSTPSVSASKHVSEAINTSVKRRWL